MLPRYTRPIASIRGKGGGGIVGTGCLVLGRYVLTCAHVVDDALGRERGTIEQPNNALTIDLPFLERMGLKARVIAWHPFRAGNTLVGDPVADIAVLTLAEETDLDGSVEPSKVDRRRPAKGSLFLTYGFPEGYDNGTEASGEVLVEESSRWLQIRDIQEFGHFVKPGFSGAPVFSLTEQQLIGMASLADSNEARRLAVAIPSHLLCKAWPPLAKPYRELFAFKEEDADLFFGRDSFIDELRAKLDKHPFAAVIGPSGSGKSSVMLAGLASRLRKEGWQIAVCRPLRDPLYQLAYELAPLLGAGVDDFEPRNKRAEEWAERLRKDPQRILDLARGIGDQGGRSGRMLVVIDQFEELFTGDNDAAEGTVARSAETTSEDGSPRQAQLLKVLEVVAAQDPHTSPIRAVATMRADFLGRALEIGRLARLLRDTDVKLGPMNAAELTEAVCRPAGEFGVTFEEGLAEELVEAMQGRPGGLPLLQFALDRLWRKQSDRRLTWAAYKGPDGKGGLETALNEHAQDVLTRLGPAAEAGVRRAMLRPVRIGDDSGTAPDARAVVKRSEFKEEDWPLVQKLVEARLVMIGYDQGSGEATVELVHEALSGAWESLRGWLVDDRSFGLWRQRLKASLDQWATSADDSLLLRGRQLAEAAGWLSTNGDALNDIERRFIEASQDTERQAADTALKDAQDRARLANEFAETAQQREKLANELAEAAQQREALANDLVESKERALEIEQIDRKRQRRTIRLLYGTLGLLVVALIVSGLFYRAAEANSKRAEMAAREAKGRQLGAEGVSIADNLSGAENAELAAALSIESWLRLPTTSAFQAATTALRELPWFRIEHGGSVSAVAFSPDGKLLATASEDGTARLIRTIDGSEIARIEHGGAVNALAFSPDGKLLATGSADNSARLINTANGSVVARLTHENSVSAVAFSPDGELIATGSDDGSARLLKTADGNEVARLAHDGAVSAVAFDPGGKLLATGSGDGGARLINTSDGREVTRIEHGGGVNAVAFSPDGTLLATGSEDHSARLINTTNGRDVARIEHGDAVYTVAFSQDGKLLATGSADTSARLIDTSDGNEVARIRHDEAVLVVAFSPNNKLLLTGTYDDGAGLFNTVDGSDVARIEHDGIVNAVAFSPDGKLLATGSSDSSARLINSADGTEVAREENNDPVNAVAFSPDGKLLAIGSGNNSARLISTADGSEVARFEQGSPVYAIAFSPDGKLLATGSADNSARLINTANGSVVARLTHENSVSAVAFSPDGELLATGSRDASARLFNISDGREVARIHHGGFVYALAFSPDGQLLATGSADNSARLISTADGREVARFGHSDPVYAVAFSPDGKLLVRGGWDRSIQLVNIADGSEITRVVHGGAVSAVAFSPDGKLLATGSWDKSARLTNTADGSEVARFPLPAAVSQVVFSPDRKLIATGTYGGDVRLQLMPSLIFEKLCKERIGRNLSVDEWKRYIGSTEDWAPTCPEWRSDPELLRIWQTRQSDPKPEGVHQ